MNNNVNDLTFFFNLAIEKHRKNDFKDAEKNYINALEIDPLHFESTFYLASLYAQTKNFLKSKDYFKKAIQIKPNYSLNYSNLGAVLKELGNFEEAITACEKAIEIEPNNAATLGNLGAVLKEIGKFGEAVIACEKAIEIEPNNLVANRNLALTLIELGEIKQAIKCYKKISKIEINPAKSYQNLGQLNVVLGDKKEAIRFFKLAIKNDPESLDNYYQLFGIDKKILNNELKDNIYKIISKSNQSNKNLAFANFLLSKYELNQKNYEKEFNYLLKAHECFLASERKKYRNDIEYWLETLPNSKELNNNKILNNKYQSNVMPIFIVGVPRCGSTLIEKVISSGSQHLETGEEIGTISVFIKKNIISKRSIYNYINDPGMELIEKYKQKKLIQDKSNYIFTDKTLDNFFYIEFIKNVFPRAKIINCKREPVSAIMSILKNNLQSIPWAHNIDHIFKYFDIYYKKINYFEKNYPKFVYTLNYEKFVNNPKTESKKLMKFCNLPWSKKCLEFYKRKDLISKTASNVQIRQAIYKDSSKKYLPYKKFLDKYGKKYSWYSKK